jgi:vacuolar-type H+-ATPase subunit E/Vma4
MKDRRYLDIYRRSVLANFEYSQAVETALSLTVDKIREMGAEPIILLLPVTEEMIALEEELVGDKFIRPLSTLSKDKNVRLIDMRRMHQYDFEDVNHLSPQGALQVINEQLIPLMGEDFE